MIFLLNRVIFFFCNLILVERGVIALATVINHRFQVFRQLIDLPGCAVMLLLHLGRGHCIHSRGSIRQAVLVLDALGLGGWGRLWYRL